MRKHRCFRPSATDSGRKRIGPRLFFDIRTAYFYPARDGSQSWPSRPCDSGVSGSPEASQAQGCAACIRSARGEAIPGWVACVRCRKHGTARKDPTPQGYGGQNTGRRAGSRDGARPDFTDFDSPCCASCRRGLFFERTALSGTMPAMRRSARRRRCHPPPSPDASRLHVFCWRACIGSESGVISRSAQRCRT
jgi:hypothetical protein